ncbi:hypothetical protein [Pseudomonas sp.]|uniref:hypothetical protein n=1 Tax=Pseudomonas sp. TaxID=306 RepID=UPI002588AC8F|nr:hypothetical protein [Pseudomonas sp.]
MTTTEHRMDVPGYERLAAVLQAAYDQAAKGKGAERHANDLPFHEQPMQQIARRRGLGFILGQADKKSEEAQGMLERGQREAWRREILGAIVYLSGALVFTDAEAEANHASYIETLASAATLADSIRESVELLTLDDRDADSVAPQQATPAPAPMHPPAPAPQPTPFDPASLFADAPGWAQWAAQDESGWWYVYADEPYADSDMRAWLSPQDEGKLWSEKRIKGKPNPDWRLTLTKRP